MMASADPVRRWKTTHPSCQLHHISSSPIALTFPLVHAETCCMSAAAICCCCCCAAVACYDMHHMVTTVAAFSHALQGPKLLTIDGLQWPVLILTCAMRHLCCLQLAFSLAFLMPVALYTHTVIPAENTTAIITAKVSIPMSGTTACRQLSPIGSLRDRLDSPSTQGGLQHCLLPELTASVLPASRTSRASAHFCPANLTTCFAWY
jgi:hypothetical protein